MTAAALIREAAGAEPMACAVVLGTGLGLVAEAVEAPVSLAYAELPGFPPTGVTGHAGRLVIGRLAGRRVAVLEGRAHVYEHGQASIMKPAIDALADLGIGTLLITNAAGSLRAEMPPGALMAIEDHIALFGPNPLIGEAGDGRFVPMNGAYDAGLLGLLADAAARAGAVLHRGVYAWVTGPSFETPAEIRALKALGADAVGMSTVPETILARHRGLRVAALSMITNFAAGLAGGAPSHAETKAAAGKGAETVAAVIGGFIGNLDA